MPAVGQQDRGPLPRLDAQPGEPGRDRALRAPEGSVERAHYSHPQYLDVFARRVGPVGRARCISGRHDYRIG